MSKVARVIVWGLGAFTLFLAVLVVDLSVRVQDLEKESKLDSYSMDDIYGRVDALAQTVNASSRSGPFRDNK